MNTQIASQQILVVDDSDAGRYVTCHTLSRAGFHVIEARDGQEALTRVRLQPDLIILDVHLPDADGFAICQQLKADPRFAHVPVLMVSAAYQSAENMVHGLNVGADAYLAHPIEPDVLLANTRALLRVREAEARVREINEGLTTRVHEGTVRLAELNAELTAYTRSLSRDIQEPLRRIQGFLGLLRRRLADNPDEKVAQYLHIIGEESGRVSQLVEDLAGLALSEGREARRDTVPLTQLVVQVRSDLEPLLRGRKVEWRLGSLPTVTGDAMMLRQAMTNLLHNALKFTRDRERAVIEVEGGVFGHEVHVRVRDNGVGFDPADTARLFELFQRLHGETYGGAGLGLANVRRIIARHGGRVWAQGQLDEGATFTFTLPHSD